MSADESDVQTTPLAQIVSVVEGHGQTLTLYNVTVPAATLEPIRSYFDVTTVSLRQGQTSEVHPENFAVLHDGESFIAACDIEQLSAALDPTGPFVEDDSPYRETPELLNEVEQSVFTDYGKRRMILASRDVEKQAWRARPAELHVGFQEFRRLRSQLDLYRRLTDGLTVHLYGVPDWEPPIDDVRTHGYQTAELRRHWFVVYRSAASGNEPDTRALLAAERAPNEYAGFWTSHRGLTERIVDRLQTVYPANEPFA